jgi:hypothetical protein
MIWSRFVPILSIAFWIMSLILSVLRPVPSLGSLTPSSHYDFFIWWIYTYNRYLQWQKMPKNQKIPILEVCFCWYLWLWRILYHILVPKSPGDVSWIKLREVCTSEQKLEEVFTVCLNWPSATSNSFVLLKVKYAIVHYRSLDNWRGQQL